MPHARLLAVDAFDRDGGAETRSDAATLVDAIDRLVERGARVINLSLAGPQNAVLGQAIARAQAKGVIVVAAAGNEGPGAEPSYPAAYADVVAVTAVDQQLVVYRRANRGSYIDFAAPGVAVPGNTPDGPHESGTSFAAPFVSAAAALILAGQPELNVADVSRKLAAGALDLGAPGRDSVYGWGLVQADGLCRRPAPIVANDVADTDSDIGLAGEEISGGRE